MASKEVTAPQGSTIFSALLDLEKKSDIVREQLPLCDDELLKLLFHGLEGASTIAWQLQGDVVAELQSRARYGSNAIAGIAKFLEIGERRIFELAQIRNEILLKAPELREANLDKSHFLVALRAKRRGKEPIEVLEYAIDNQLSVRQLRAYIDEGKESAVVSTIFYILTALDSIPLSLPPECVQRRYLSPTARIVQHGGIDYLELKEHTREEA